MTMVSELDTLLYNLKMKVFVCWECETMADLQTLLAAVDELSPQELIQLRDYVKHRADTIVWKLTPADLKTIDEAMRPVQQEAAGMSEAEIVAAIDEAIAEARDERKTKSRD